MVRGITRRLALGGLLPLAALGVVAAAGCDSTSPAASAPPAATATATTTADRPAPERSASTGRSGDAATVKTTTGASRSLPDGTHAAYVTKLNTSARTVTFNKVELLSGAAARKAYQKANPGATDGPPNDYVMVDDNKLLRTLPVADDVTVLVVGATADGAVVQDKRSSFAKLPAYLADKDNSTLFRLTVRDGRIVQLRGIYLP
jgi:hypothetical protein